MHCVFLLLFVLLGSCHYERIVEPWESKYANKAAWLQYEAVVELGTLCIHEHAGLPSTKIGENTFVVMKTGSGVSLGDGLYLTAKHVADDKLYVFTLEGEATTLPCKETYRRISLTGEDTTYAFHVVYAHHDDDWMLVSSSEDITKTHAKLGHRPPRVGDEVCSVGGEPRTRNCGEVFYVDEDFIFRDTRTFQGNSGSGVWFQGRIVGVEVKMDAGSSGKPYSIIQRVDTTKVDIQY